MAEEPVKQIHDAMASKEIPQIYFNGFAMSVSTGDIILLAQRNGESAYIINLSYTVAKTLAERLTNIVAVLEKGAGQPILTTDQVKKCLEDTPSGLDE